MNVYVVSRTDTWDEDEEWVIVGVAITNEGAKKLVWDDCQEFIEEAEESGYQDYEDIVDTLDEISTYTILDDIEFIEDRLVHTREGELLMK